MSASLKTQYLCVKLFLVFSDISNKQKTPKWWFQGPAAITVPEVNLTPNIRISSFRGLHLDSEAPLNGPSGNWMGKLKGMGLFSIPGHPSPFFYPTPPLPLRGPVHPSLGNLRLQEWVLKARCSPILPCKPLPSPFLPQAKWDWWDADYLEKFSTDTFLSR